MEEPPDNPNPPGQFPLSFVRSSRYSRRPTQAMRVILRLAKTSVLERHGPGPHIKDAILPRDHERLDQFAARVTTTNQFLECYLDAGKVHFRIRQHPSGQITDVASFDASPLAGHHFTPRGPAESVSVLPTRLSHS